MGDAFLRNVTSSLNVSATLMKIDGQIVASSSKKATAIKLTPAQINLIDAGQPLYLDHNNGDDLERHLFTMIPLGTTDRVLLSLEASLSVSTKIQKETIGGMILVDDRRDQHLATIIFFRRVSSHHPAGTGAARCGRRPSVAAT